MGYLSDVCIVLTKDAAAKIDDAAHTYLGDKYKDFPFYYPDKHLVHESGAELFLWKLIKWYHYYPEIGAVQKFLLNFLDPAEYFFVRTGEDYEDVEEAGVYYNSPFDPYFKVEIVFTEVEDNNNGNTD